MSKRTHLIEKERERERAKESWKERENLPKTLKPTCGWFKNIFHHHKEQEKQNKTSEGEKKVQPLPPNQPREHTKQRG